MPRDQAQVDVMSPACDPTLPALPGDLRDRRIGDHKLSSKAMADAMTNRPHEFHEVATPGPGWEAMIWHAPSQHTIARASSAGWYVVDTHCGCQYHTFDDMAALDKAVADWRSGLSGRR